jgi:tetratricopeptide (TPR) repeat protein
VTWLDRLEGDHDNLRAALAWSVQTQRVDVALRLVSATWRMWQIRGHLHEGRRNVDLVVSLPGAAEHPEDLAPALEAGGGIAYWQGDVAACSDYYERALAAFEQLGDEAAIARAFYNLGFAQLPRGDAAAKLFKEAIARHEQLGDQLGVARARWGLVTVAFVERDHEAALHYVDLCIPVFREAGELFDLAWAEHMAGYAEYGLHKLDAARVRWEASATWFLQTGDLSATVEVLYDFALLAEAVGDAERAIRLFAASDAAGKRTGAQVLDSQIELMQHHRVAQDDLDAEAVARFDAEGRALTIEEAMRYALEDVLPGD